MTEHRLERRDRRRVLIVIVVTQLVVALATALIITTAYQRLDKNIDPGAEPDHRAKKHRVADGEPLNILVMGSDSRVGKGNDVDGQTDIGQRSDTTILVHISADRKTVYGVSLPRDAMVARPECTTEDGETVPASDSVIFNDAFSQGGPKCTVEQVESLTGIYIDHYVTIDFNGFKDMVDAVHGVTVCIPEDVDDSAHGITFDAGTQELNGQQALNYVRERYVLSANSDIGRMKRQQAFIASMINKVVSAGTLTQPTRVYAFLKAATASIVTDPKLASVSKLANLAYQFRKTNLDDITFITVPFEEYAPDPNRLQWAPSAKGLWPILIKDQPLPKRYREGVISANQTPGGSGSGNASGGTSSSASGSASESPTSPESSPSTPTGELEADQNGLCA
ncbi:MAG TPA: LCP family protein [Nocardioides sp.]|uniref:LCP family protein n=1 Tax=uncultured Nocardioides sp. TaxID=198441 RepID=UPI000EE91428|nr:LCP family protein [uncultured Nocardioides sp.]HCB02743.1 LytR family transcriptional regulator [Nocardioides sp.]HRI94474.1 LCP family protein [Nocardioides sp.]HRK48592.1 LCP family protein [Nocardioides sp.]